MILFFALFLMPVYSCTAMEGLVHQVAYQPVEGPASLKEISLAFIEKQDYLPERLTNLSSDICDLISARLKRKHAFLMYTIFHESHAPQIYILPIDRVGDDNEGNFLDNCRYYLKGTSARDSLVWDLESNIGALDLPENGIHYISQDHRYLFHLDSNSYLSHRDMNSSRSSRTIAYDLKRMTAVASDEFHPYEGDVLVFNPESRTIEVFKNLWLIYPKRTSEFGSDKDTQIAKITAFAKSMPENSYILIQSIGTAFLRKYVCNAFFCEHVLCEREIVFSNDGLAAGCNFVAPKYVDLDAETSFPIHKIIPGLARSAISRDMQSILKISSVDRALLLYDMPQLVAYLKSLPRRKWDNNLPCRLPYQKPKGVYKMPDETPELFACNIVSINYHGTLATLAFEGIQKRLYYLYDLTTGCFIPLNCPELSIDAQTEEQRNLFREDIQFNDQGDLFIANNHVHGKEEQQRNLVFKFDFSKLAPTLNLQQLLRLISLSKKKDDYLKSSEGRLQTEGLVASLNSEKAKHEVAAYFAKRIAAASAEA